MQKKISLLTLLIVLMMMTTASSLAVVDRVTLPIDINANTFLSVGTYYHSDEGLDLTEDDFYFNTDDPGIYTFHFHPIGKVNEFIISVKDRYYEECFGDHLTFITEDYIYDCYLDGNETYYLQLYAVNGLLGEVHFNFTINPPSNDFSNQYSSNSSSNAYATYSGNTSLDGIGCYVGEMFVVDCSEWISLFREPDPSSARVAKVPLGALVTDCFEAENGFYLCEYNGLTGYILQAYLSTNPPGPNYDQSIRR